MKNRNIFLILASIFAMALFSLQACKEDEDDTDDVNKPPQCSISSPNNGDKLNKNDSITIVVEAKDSDGSIAEVRFYIDDVGIGSATSFPYNYVWDASAADEGTHQLKATAIDNSGASASDQISIVLEGNGGSGTWNPVTNPATGQTWMDRNLGASQVATSSTDDQAYGDLYQWGRGTDGHEKRNSETTTILCNSDTPGHGNFITVSSFPYDWRSPQNAYLWMGASAANNPCPSGYRLPSSSEWHAERQSWSSNNADGAFNSPLKLPLAGYRNRSSGSLFFDGFGGYYWSASPGDTFAMILLFDSDVAGVGSYDRAYGCSVRCIKD